ncbi:MAG: polyhydroxybutyrate depolymerase [Bacteroidia bacterium]|jgi:polyhydroxybutyrate depolymerase
MLISIFLRITDADGSFVGWQPCASRGCPLSHFFRTILLFRATLGLCASIWLVACAAQPVSEIPQPGVTVARELYTAGDDITRNYRLHVPHNYQPDREWPLVVAIHGAYSTASYHEQRTGFSRVADTEGFIVLYPKGVGLFGFLTFWNAGHCCASSLARNIDDIGFIFAAIEDAAQLLNIDRSRIYVTGFSNGGMLAHYIGAERSHSVAAIAPVAGTLGGSQSPVRPVWRVPVAARPLPVMIMHGTADDRVPYRGGPRPDRPNGQQYLSVQDSVDYWRLQNGCTDTSSAEQGYDQLLQLTRWQDCVSGSEVSLWSLQQWRHTWPGPDDPAKTEEPDLHGFDAARAIWAFFRQHQLPD